MISPGWAAGHGQLGAEPPSAPNAPASTTTVVVEQRSSWHHVLYTVVGSLIGGLAMLAFEEHLRVRRLEQEERRHGLHPTD
jgi:hypothetical protein